MCFASVCVARPPPHDLCQGPAPHAVQAFGPAASVLGLVTQRGTTSRVLAARHSRRLRRYRRRLRPPVAVVWGYGLLSRSPCHSGLCRRTPPRPSAAPPVAERGVGQTALRRGGVFRRGVKGLRAEQRREEESRRRRPRLLRGRGAEVRGFGSGKSRKTCALRPVAEGGGSGGAAADGSGGEEMEDLLAAWEVSTRRAALLSGRGAATASETRDAQRTIGRSKTRGLRRLRIRGRGRVGGLAPGHRADECAEEDVEPRSHRLRRPSRRGTGRTSVPEYQRPAESHEGRPRGESCCKDPPPP